MEAMQPCRYIVLRRGNLAAWIQVSITPLARSLELACLHPTLACVRSTGTKVLPLSLTWTHHCSDPTVRPVTPDGPHPHLPFTIDQTRFAVGNRQ